MGRGNAFQFADYTKSDGMATKTNFFREKDWKLQVCISWKRSGLVKKVLGCWQYTEFKSAVWYSNLKKKAKAALVNINKIRDSIVQK